MVHANGTPAKGQDRQAPKETANPAGAGALEAAEVGRLGVDPAVWTRLKKYWVETNDSNKTDTIEGYAQGTLTRHDLKAQKEGGSSLGASPARLLVASLTVRHMSLF